MYISGNDRSIKKNKKTLEYNILKYCSKNLLHIINCNMACID